jgi:hypothetical protein
MAMAGALAHVRVLTVVEVDFGQPAATAMALAFDWAADSVAEGIVVVDPVAEAVVVVARVGVVFEPPAKSSAPVPTTRMATMTTMTARRIDLRRLFARCIASSF